MNPERGFRRIVLTVSLIAAGVGLVVTGYDTYRTIRHVAAERGFEACVKSAELHYKTNRNKNASPQIGAVIKGPRFWNVYDGEQYLYYNTEDEARQAAALLIERSAEAARNYARDICLDVVNRTEPPAHLNRALERFHKITGTGEEWYGSFKAGLFPLILGVLVSTGLFALPWGVFYLVRRIVRGFVE